jgi:hypothetical protein
MRSITEYRLIIASPSDVYEERKAVFDAIAELNMQLEASNVSVRALGWEGSASPGIGADPQAVINKQLFQSYDMLIAIFGTKLGAPTTSARSGSIEEIDKAISNRASVFEDQRIQIYFKDSVQNLSQVDARELGALLEYRSELAGRGVLYSTFSETAELAKAVRINVQRAVIKLMELPANLPSASNQMTLSVDQTEPQDEPGILDLVETSENSIAEMTEQLENLAQIINKIAEETKKQTILLEEQNLADVSTAAKKASINGFADFLMENAQQLFDKSSRARILFRNLFDAQTDLQSMILGNMSAEERANAKQTVTRGYSEMLTGALGARENVLDYKRIVEALPRITSQFHRARKRLVEALNENIEYLNDVERGILSLLF